VHLAQQKADVARASCLCEGRGGWIVSGNEEAHMKLRLWPGRSARRARIATRVEQKDRVRGAQAQIRQTRERVYQPPIQQQNWTGGSG
jgi:hypothetical protein